MSQIGTQVDEEAVTTQDDIVIDPLVPFDDYKPHTLNYTDIQVWHDPVLEKDHVAKINNDQYKWHNEEDGVSSLNEVHDNKKVDAIWEPVIKVNSKVLEANMITMMKIDYQHFLPTIILQVNDIGDMIKNFDIGGMNSHITVIFIPSVDGAYRKISLTFYITNTQTIGSDIIYYGKLKVPEFNFNKIGSITFDGDPKIKFTQKGCIPKRCCQAPNRICNFWELLHVIASYSQLGFGSTNKCKEINDRLPRNVRNQHWDEYIQEQLEFSGIDEDSIFDAWVDLYGYLDLVNVSYVMNEDVKVNELGIHPEMGLRMRSQGMPETKLNEMVHRTLHNFHNARYSSNLEITNYEIVNNNAKINNKGTFRNVRIFGLESTGGNNSLTEYQNMIIENSVNGQYIGSYNVDRDANIEMSFNDEYYSTVKQKMLRESYFDKLRAHVLKVEMSKINFGLERGTLVILTIFDASNEGKATIFNSTTNIFGGRTDDTNDTDKMDVTLESQTRLDKEVDNRWTAPNMSLTGMYYIDGMEFIYDDDNNEIIQYLYLIKKTANITNYNDAPARMNYDLIPNALNGGESSSSSSGSSTSTSSE